MKIYSAVFALLLSLALSSVAYAAVWPDNGHEYVVIAVPGISWTAARAAAQARGPGWDLATIGSAAENTFVESLLNSASTDRAHFWLGATDNVSEGTWVWVDGTPWSFTDWWSGEPGDTNNEDYLAYDLRSGSWAWNDAPDDLAATFPTFPQGYVAELSASAPPPGTSAANPIPTLSAYGLMLTVFGLLVLAVRRLSSKSSK